MKSWEKIFEDIKHINYREDVFKISKIKEINSVNMNEMYVYNVENKLLVNSLLSYDSTYLIYLFCTIEQKFNLNKKYEQFYETMQYLVAIIFKINYLKNKNFEDAYKAVFDIGNSSCFKTKYYNLSKEVEINFNNLKNILDKRLEKGI